MYPRGLDYRKYQNDRPAHIQEAEHARLAESLQSHPDKDPPATPPTNRIVTARLVGLALFVLLMVTLLAMPRVSGAHHVKEPGKGEPFADAMVAYRLGHYYFVHGDYSQAIVKYRLAIKGIPAKVFEAASTYRVLYWDMGDAYLLDGQYDEALSSYQHYLDLAGDDASDKAIAYVEQLATAINQHSVVSLTLLGDQ
jgi:tetratricopeptide (TPR) repeat protein